MPTTTSTSKVRFIVNPISGNGKNRNIDTLIAQHLDKTKFQYEICFTKAPEDALALSREAKEKGFDIACAVGGDGTVHEVGKALIGSNTALAIIPTGSGNGLARHCGIPCNTLKALELLNKMPIHPIDTVKIHDDYFLNIAGIGFDAHIAKRFAEYGKRGFFSYCKLILKDVFSYKPQDYTLQIDGKEINCRAMFISFANSAQYGNNFCISSKIKIDDGLLNIVIFRSFPWYAAFKLVFQSLTSNLDKSPYVTILSGKEVLVKGGPFTAHLDGEPVTIPAELRLKVVPSSLKLVCW